MTTTNRNWTLPVVDGSKGEWGLILNDDTFEEIDADVQAILDARGVADGVAALNANGKVAAGQIPNLSITNTKTFSSESNLTTWVEAEEGDVGIVNNSDGNGTAYILTTNDPTSLTNWAELKTPESPVQDVFGRTGSVTAESGDYTASEVTNAAVDGDKQPPESHDNTAHSKDYITQSDVDVSGKADDPHGDAAHSEDYAKSSETTDPSEIDSTNWGDYEIQKDGTDGSGVINFKTL
jgi:hypothetical protein